MVLETNEDVASAVGETDPTQWLPKAKFPDQGVFKVPNLKTAHRLHKMAR